MTKPGPAKVWCTGGGWWMAPDDGLEVVDGERVRVEAPVPAHDVERVLGVDEAGEAGPVADEDGHVGAVDHAAARPGPAGPARRTALPLELAPARQVALGEADVAAEPRTPARRAGRPTEDPTVRGAGGMTT